MFYLRIPYPPVLRTVSAFRPRQGKYSDIMIYSPCGEGRPQPTLLITSIFHRIYPDVLRVNATHAFVIGLSSPCTYHYFRVNPDLLQGTLVHLTTDTANIPVIMSDIAVDISSSSFNKVRSRGESVHLNGRIICASNCLAPQPLEQQYHRRPIIRVTNG